MTIKVGTYLVLVVMVAMGLLLGLTDAIARGFLTRYYNYKRRNLRS